MERRAWARVGSRASVRVDAHLRQEQTRRKKMTIRVIKCVAAIVGILCAAGSVSMARPRGPYAAPPPGAYYDYGYERIYRWSPHNSGSYDIQLRSNPYPYEEPGEVVRVPR
jgi:hypothetical protein